MKAINVKIKSVKVASFSPAKEDVSFIIIFDDGKEKELTRNLPVDKGETAALQIIRDIRKVETNLNAEFDGKMILDNYTNILIENEEKLTKDLEHFFSKVFEQVRVIKNQRNAEGYMALINKVNSLKIEF